MIFGHIVPALRTVAGVLVSQASLPVGRRCRRLVCVLVALWLLWQPKTRVHHLVYCRLWLCLSLLICISPCSDLPFCCSRSASFTLLQSPSFASPIRLIAVLLISLSILILSAPVSRPFPPPIPPHNHLPPPFPLAKVHAINQKKMRLPLPYSGGKLLKSYSSALLRYCTCRWLSPLRVCASDH